MTILQICQAKNVLRVLCDDDDDHLHHHDGFYMGVLRGLYARLVWPRRVAETQAGATRHPFTCYIFASTTDYSTETVKILPSEAPLALCKTRKDHEIDLCAPNEWMNEWRKKNEGNWVHLKCITLRWDEKRSVKTFQEIWSNKLFFIITHLYWTRCQELYSTLL